MRIGIDIDDTLVDTRSIQYICWKEYVQNNPNKLYKEDELPDGINTDYDNAYINIFWDTYRERLTYEPPIKKDALKVLKMLKNKGFELFIVTSRRESKYKNLKNNLSNTFNKDEVIFNDFFTGVMDKGEFLETANLDILIDDTISHCVSAINHNKKAILFNTNKEYEGLQADNWLDVYDIISKLLD